MTVSHGQFSFFGQGGTYPKWYDSKFTHTPWEYIYINDSDYEYYLYGKCIFYYYYYYCNYQCLQMHIVPTGIYYLV